MHLGPFLRGEFGDVFRVFGVDNGFGGEEAGSLRERVGMLERFRWIVRWEEGFVGGGVGREECGEEWDDDGGE